MAAILFIIQIVWQDDLWLSDMRVLKEEEEEEEEVDLW